MRFQQKLDNIVEKNNTLLCVGLDSDLAKIPQEFKKKKYPIFEFNKHVIEQTAGLVCAYKPNSAFYEAQGTDGIEQLKLTCDYLREKYSQIVIILDAKRADIGSTNEGYTTFAFDWLGVDAITLHPYLGEEALRPFLDRRDKGIFILCRTSNPGAGEFQDLEVNGEPLYKIVARRVVDHWNKNGNCGLVVGATYPEELRQVREIAGDAPLLVPGIGSQGGDVEKVLRAGVNSKGAGLIINSSRAIIFARYQRQEAAKLKDAINNYRT